MVTRPVDANGDMIPVLAESQMVTGAQAVALAVKYRIGMLYGEWWEDDELGFRVPDFLGQVRGLDGAKMIARYTSAYIAETDGVDGVLDAQIELIGHSAEYSATIKCADQTEQVEVDLNGLL